MLAIYFPAHVSVTAAVAAAAAIHTRVKARMCIRVWKRERKREKTLGTERQREIRPGTPNFSSACLALSLSRRFVSCRFARFARFGRKNPAFAHPTRGPPRSLSQSFSILHRAAKRCAPIHSPSLVTAAQKREAEGGRAVYLIKIFKLSILFQVQATHARTHTHH